VPPLHPDAWRVVPLFAIAALVLFWVWTPLGWVGVAFTIWCATLFREPERVSPARPAAVVSPIDGLVVEVGSAPPPSELGIEGGDLLCVSIALGPWDSHVARVPAEGRLVKLARDHGGRTGERLAARFESEAGTIAVTLVAEGPGRRIHADTREDDKVQAGGRLGLVLFAGHVEVYLPAGMVPAVAAGQRMVAGETVLGEAPPLPRSKM